jgi:hypothetical protein
MAKYTWKRQHNIWLKQKQAELAFLTRGWIRIEAERQNISVDTIEEDIQYIGSLSGYIDNRLREWKETKTVVELLDDLMFYRAIKLLKLHNHNSEMLTWAESLKWPS